MTDPAHPTAVRCHELAFRSLLATAFFAGFSLPLARAALLVTAALTVWNVLRGPRRLRFPATGWLWLAYVLVAVVTTAVLARTTVDSRIFPAKGLRKIDKLTWFLAIPLVPTLIDTRARIRETVTAFAFGASVGAMRLLLLNPIGAWVQTTLPFPDDPGQPGRGAVRLQALTDALGITERLRTWTLHHWRARTYGDALAKLGGMAAAQRLMVGVVAALALALHARGRGERRTARRRWALTLLLAAGLVVALKRGPWISTLLVATPLLVAGLGRRRMLPVLLLGVVLVLALPAARARLAQIPSEFTTDKGGRALMWRHIVPGLLEDHPWGVGFRSLTNRAMRRYSRRVELNQDHVHSNPLQILVELGGQGLALYLLWMALALRDGVRLASRAGPEPADRLLLAAPLAMLSTLVLNGLVEYNFADGELVILYGLAMGLAAVRPSCS